MLRSTGTTGLVVSERDVDGLAEALMAILADDAVAARLGAGGRALVERNFDVTDQAEKVGRLYDALV